MQNQCCHTWVCHRFDDQGSRTTAAESSRVATKSATLHSLDNIWTDAGSNLVRILTSSPPTLGEVSGPMDTLPNEQLKQGMLASGITHQGPDSHLRREIDQRFAGESPFVQRKQNNKLFVSSWTRLLGVAFTSLAAAYFLLLCFRLIESARQWAPPTRSLAARRDESCDSGSVSGDGDEGGSGLTGHSAEDIELEGFGEGSLLLHHEAFELQGLADGTQEVVAAGLQGAAGSSQVEVDLEAEADEEIWEYGSGVASNPQRPFRAYDLDLWEGRNMPMEEEQRLICLFQRMKEAASSCRSLLPVLTHKQRLQLTNQVLRLLTLDLGAIYLVKEDIEPYRKAVGDSLIELAQHVLGRNDEGDEDLRAHLKDLTVLIERIKEPRRLEKEMSADKYKRKMISIIGTAEIVMKNCLGVLKGLLRLRTDTSEKRLPSKVVEQQLSVLKTVYHTHSYYVAKDGTLRLHILESQKSTAVFSLLGTQHFSVFQGVIAPLKDLQNEIDEAVRAAGGLLPSQEPETGERGSASNTMEEGTAERVGQQERKSKPQSRKLPRKRFAQSAQPPSSTVTPAPHTEDGAQRSPPVPWLPAWSFQRDAGSLLQQHLLIFNEHLQTHSPHFLYPHAVLPTAGPSMFGSQAQGGEASYGHPCSPWPCTSLPSSSYLSTTQHPANPRGSSLLQEHASASRGARAYFSGGSSGAHLMPATPLPPMNVGEPSEWVRPPAPIQEGGYSLFGGGGIPPWFPFPHATPASFERRATASDGWPRPEEEGAHRLITDDEYEARRSIPRDRTQGGRQ